MLVPETLDNLRSVINAIIEGICFASDQGADFLEEVSKCRDRGVVLGLRRLAIHANG